jgi:hypothetical protein
MIDGGEQHGVDGGASISGDVLEHGVLISGDAADQDVAHYLLPLFWVKHVLYKLKKFT